MLIRKGFRFALNTGTDQAHTLRRFAGCSRFVWNQALKLQKERLDAEEKCLCYADLCKELTAWKDEFEFLKEAPSQALQQTLKDFDRALWDGLKGAKGFAVWKKKGRHDSFRYPQGFHLEPSRVFLPKIGWLSFRQSQQIVGTPKNITVSRHAGRWFISVQTEQEVADPVHPSRAAVGIDRGIASFAALSDGELIQGPQAFETLRAKLARAQKRLARKTKFSNNWKRQRRKVARLHTHIADARRDFLQKTSTIISKNHAMIVIEDLNVKGMTKSAAGTLEAPGTNVAAKRALNRRILDQGWSEFARELEYKQGWRGGSVIKVPPQYTSQTCSRCGHTAKESRETQAEFRCVACDYTDNADLNAARTILAAGHAAIACGGVRQEVREAGTHRMAA